MNQKTKNKRRRKNRCKNKVRYKSKAEANWYAGYYTALNGRLMNAYYCDVHHCWHLGNDNGRHKDKPWTELSWTMKREEARGI